MRRTKIVATIGPACGSPEVIAQLLEAGMDVARLNFSHGTHEYHANIITMLREQAAIANKPLAILQDLQGPKIRTGLLANGQPVLLSVGNRITITTDAVVGTSNRVSTTYTALPNDVQVGDSIMLSDGLIELRVVNKTATDVETEVVFGGMLREKQGINLPGVVVSSPSLTEKDAEDLAFGVAHDVDFIALSFVRSAADIDDIKQRIAAAGKDIPVIAKIEKTEALDELHEIVQRADGIMIARGDLGVEMPPQQVPVAQKRVIRVANEAGKPVITATQMLDSMIRNPRPTRAEASDVANAILDGTDAIMLSGETANGDFPVQAVRMMAAIAQEAEASDWHCEQPALPDVTLAPAQDIAHAVSAATVTIANSMHLRAIVGLTMTGNTARLVAQQRPRVPILAFTPSETAYRRMNLIGGVTPLMGPYTDRLVKLSWHVYDTLIAQGLAEPDDMVLLIGGHPFATLGSTNFLKIEQVRSMARKPPLDEQ